MAAQRTEKPEVPETELAFGTHGVRVSKWLTTGSVVGLGAGLLGGVAAYETQNPILLRTADALSPLGALWTNALLMLVIPLMAGTLFCALVGQEHRRGGGRRTALSFAVFITFLIGAGLYATVVGLPMARRFTVDPATVAALRERAMTSATIVDRLDAVRGRVAAPAGVTPEMAGAAMAEAMDHEIAP